jgi:hypothetical protein
MNPAPVNCPKCNATLLGGVFNRPDLSPCPSCGVPLQIEVFPAFFRPPAPIAAGEAIMTEGEASCFFHPQKKAVRPCDSCGRFICALCDCEFGRQHLCPSCLEAGQTKGKIKSLEKGRTLYDSIALALSIAPLLIFYLTFITAPMAMFIAIRYWKAPLSLVRRSRFRFVIAMILASFQIIGWMAVLVFFYERHTHG